MRERLKRIYIFILVMSIVVVTQLKIDVSAAEEHTTVDGVVDFENGTGVIRIEGNTGQSLKGKTLMFYKLFDAKNSNGLESIQYSINESYASALKTVVASELEKEAENVTEYEVIDYLQSLNSNPVEGAKAQQEEEGRYSDYRYFMEALIAQLKTEGILGEAIYVEDTKPDNSIEVRGLPFGYYLVEELTDAEGTHSAISLSMLGTANPESVMHMKSDYPTVTKKIQEDDNKDVIGEDGWNDIADFEIGQDVPYKYTSVIPNINGYHNYYYAWHDVMDEALTLQEDSIQISIAGEVESASKVYQLSNSEYQLRKDVADTTFVIEVEDIKAIIDREFPNMNERNENQYGQTVTVTYKAMLNEKAALNPGRPGFENDVRLEFSNNPNQGGEEETGFTPWDTVVCFTYQINGVKINNHEAVLEGAQFKLYSDDQCKNEVSVKKVGNAYYVVNQDAWDGDTLAEAVTMVSDAEGKFDIYGLDSGIYYLKEIEAPSGYRTLLDPIVITISPQYTTERNQYVKGEGAGTEIMNLKATADIKSFFDGAYQEESKNLEVNQEEGSMHLSVVNKVGAKLPVTGSYSMILLGVAGTLLMVSAWRRSKKEHE